MPCKKYRYQKISTRWLSENWGDLNGPQRKQRLLEEMAASEEGQRSFWSKVKKGEPDDCWEWQAAFTPRWYGVYSAKPNPKMRIYVRAHRVSYFLSYGVNAGDHCICHKCDNPRCVNPKHLFFGTSEDNIADKVKKERQARGPKIHTTKLTADQVQQIRILRFRDNLSCVKLARRFHVSDEQISRICLFLYWKYLPVPKEVLDAF